MAAPATIPHRSAINRDRLRGRDQDRDRFRGMEGAGLRRRHLYTWRGRPSGRDCLSRDVRQVPPMMGYDCNHDREVSLMVLSIEVHICKNNEGLQSAEDRPTDGVRDSFHRHTLGCEKTRLTRQKYDVHIHRHPAKRRSVHATLEVNENIPPDFMKYFRQKLALTPISNSAAFEHFQPQPIRPRLSFLFRFHE